MDCLINVLNQRPLAQRVLGLLIVLSFSEVCIGQADESQQLNNRWQHLSVGASAQNGYVFATNDFLKGSNSELEQIDDFQTFGIQVARQTVGEKSWEQLFNYPQWGIGIQVSSFDNPEEIGTPIGAYGFFNAPFIRFSRLSFNYALGLGATFNWKPYNPITNQHNTAIGAGQAFLVNAGLLLQYNLTPRIDVDGGVFLDHFSNGALKIPNYGINTIAPKIGLRYNFYDPPDFKKHPIEPFEKRNEFAFSLFGGIKNVVFDSVDVDLIEQYQGVFFPVIGISALANRQLGRVSKVGVGFSTTYNGALDAQVAVDDGELEAGETPWLDKMQISVYPSYELVVNRVSIILQPAIYLYRKKVKKPTPVFYQRIGLKYHFSNQFFAGLSLRDYSFHVSDFIEWHLGFTLSKK